jgi:hypothetical protein
LRERLVKIGGRIEHDGCPVMTWMVGNVVALADAKDNVYPRKEQRARARSTAWRPCCPRWRATWPGRRRLR